LQKEIAVRTYTVSNLERKGNREQAQHYLLISNWFNLQLAGAKMSLINCRSDMARVDQNFRGLSEDMVVAMERLRDLDNQFEAMLNSGFYIDNSEREFQFNTISNQRSEVINEVYKREDDLSELVRLVRNKCQPSNLEIVIPERPLLGSSLLGQLASSN
jgi:hypothetical protein